MMKINRNRACGGFTTSLFHLSNNIGGFFAWIFHPVGMRVFSLILLSATTVNATAVPTTWVEEIPGQGGYRTVTVRKKVETEAVSRITTEDPSDLPEADVHANVPVDTQKGVEDSLEASERFSEEAIERVHLPSAKVELVSDKPTGKEPRTKRSPSAKDTFTL
jgi:hypothetical protein